MHHAGQVKQWLTSPASHPRVGSPGSISKATIHKTDMTVRNASGRSGPTSQHCHIRGSRTPVATAWCASTAPTGVADNSNSIVRHGCVAHSLHHGSMPHGLREWLNGHIAGSPHHGSYKATTSGMRSRSCGVVNVPLRVRLTKEVRTHRRLAETTGSARNKNNSIAAR